MKITNFLLGAVVAAALAMPAAAAGLYTNGLPVAVPPFTGDETIPVDTNLPSGLNPQTEAMTLDQLSAFTGGNGVSYSANAATTAQVMTPAQVVGDVGGSPLVVMDMTGSIGGALALTTPSAAAIIAAAPGLTSGLDFVLRVVNRTPATNAWTLTAGSGVTVTGTAAISAATWREYQVTATSATAVTFRNIGSGTI